jgi:hypothetical protein
MIVLLYIVSEGRLAMKAYQKPTHTGLYLHFKSNHPHHVKRGVVHGLIS